MEDILFDLYYKSAHRNEELEQTIEELRGKLKYRRNENITLAGENNKLQDDLKQARNEIRRLNNQIDNLQRNVGYLCEENIMLKHELNEVKNNDNNI